MSFSGPRIDEVTETGRHPARAAIVGLLGNALGYDRQEHQALQALQERILVASRVDLPGTIASDYQTVALGLVPGYAQTLGSAAAGISDDQPEGKTHQRWRQYVADGAITVAVSLAAGEGPNATDCHFALLAPARPLFLGRKGFFPSRPISGGSIHADTLDGALSIIPRHARAAAGPLAARWPRVPGSRPGTTLTVPGDDRDWANGIGVGRSRYVTGFVNPPTTKETP